MNNFVTFEKEKVYKSPTEVLDIKNIKTIKSDDNKNSFIFVNNKNKKIIFQNIETTDGTFKFQANSFEEKEAWLGYYGFLSIKFNDNMEIN